MCVCMSHNDLQSGLTRRRVLALGASVGISGLAGCLGGTNNNGATGSGGGTTGGASEGTTASPENGGTLVVASPGDPQNLDPQTTTIDVAQQILDNVVEGLFELDKNLDVQPVLAKDYDVSDDGKTYTISLKQGVRFHTGTELTSADVKYSIERILDPDTGSPAKANFEFVDSIDASKDYTVTFTLSKPFAPFITNLAQSGEIIPKGSAKNQNLKQQPVGTGPFTLDTWQADNKVVLSRFDNYHDNHRPRLDDVRFNMIPEAATRLTQLQSGPAHMMYGIPYQKADQITSADQTSLQSISGLWKQSFWMNTTREPFTNPKVRRALSYAINRQQLVQGVLFGKGNVAHSPVPPTSSWRKDMDLDNGHSHSKQKAKSLLKQADVDPTSIKATIKVQRTPGPTYADTATLIQSQLAQIGMNIDVQVQDFSTWLQEVWEDKNYDLSLGSFSSRIDPDGWYYRQFHSKGAWNIWQYSNGTVDSLLEKGRTTTDRQKRANIYSKVNTQISKDVPMTYLYFRKELTGLKSVVGKYELTPTHSAEFENVYLSDS